MSGNPLLNALSAIRTPPVMGISVGYDTLANALSGVPANLAGAPVDMAYMMTMRPEEMAGIATGMPNQRPELREFPGSSDWIGEKMGADVDSLPFLLSALISPDGSDVALPAAKLAAGGKLDDLIQAMTVFHGSPHKWDKVDLSKVGTGEGAQAYGHGFYVAEDRGVAEGYKRSLQSKADIVDASGEKITPADEVEELAVMYFTPQGRRELDSLLSQGDYPAEWGAVKAKIDQWDSDGVHLGGNLYELDLPDETIGKMLDWDKPLSEQPESVRSGLNDAIRQLAANMGFDDITDPVAWASQNLDDPTGRGVYQAIAARAPSTADASEKLRRLGIPGIKYLDGTSRSAGEGTRNFVVFDESYITPLKRNGEEIAQSTGASKGTISGYGVDRELIDTLSSVAPDADASISQKGNTLRLNKIVVPKESRNQGIGSKFMEELTRYADENGLTVVLTAEGDFGGSKAAQQRFYKRHGFTLNKGRNRDYEYTENMIRLPSK